jgi:uncharacterized protein YecT (DUF1311 family)
LDSHFPDDIPAWATAGFAAQEFDVKILCICKDLDYNELDKCLNLSHRQKLMKLKKPRGKQQF